MAYLLQYNILKSFLCFSYNNSAKSVLTVFCTKSQLRELSATVDTLLFLSTSVVKLRVCHYALRCPFSRDTFIEYLKTYPSDEADKFIDHFIKIRVPNLKAPNKNLLLLLFLSRNYNFLTNSCKLL